MTIANFSESKRWERKYLWLLGNLLVKVGYDRSFSRVCVCFRFKKDTFCIFENVACESIQKVIAKICAKYFANISQCWLFLKFISENVKNSQQHVKQRDRFWLHEVLQIVAKIRTYCEREEQISAAVRKEISGNFVTLRKKTEFRIFAEMEKRHFRFNPKR